jgi:hypothetical protein
MNSLAQNNYECMATPVIISQNMSSNMTSPYYLFKKLFSEIPFEFLSY